MSSELRTEDHLRISGELLTLSAWLVAARSDDGLAIGWAVTQVFYAAVHALSACMLARHNARAPAHQDRTHWFRDYPELRKSEFLDYRSLKWASEESRYQGQHYTAGQYAELRKISERLVSHWSALAKKAS